MVMLQIFEFVDSPKTLKFTYLEKEILFFLQIKKFIHYTLKAIVSQKKLPCGGNF